MFLKIFWNKNGSEHTKVMPLDKAKELMQKMENNGIKTRFEVDVKNPHSSNEGVI